VTVRKSRYSVHFTKYVVAVRHILRPYLFVCSFFICFHDVVEFLSEVNVIPHTAVRFGLEIKNVFV